MTIVAVIPARGGSKRIPDKNIINLCGKPLLHWTGIAALDSQYIDHVIVSTDSIKIQNLSYTIGLDSPFLRPKKLSTSGAGMVGVMQHALKWFNGVYDDVEAFILLQPTSPLRTHKHIDESIELFMSSKADSLVSVSKVPHIYHPDIVHKVSDGLLYPFSEEICKNQQEPSDIVAYARNGPAILINKPEVVQRRDKFGNSLIPYIMKQRDSIDIDEYEDLYVAQSIIKNRQEIY